MLGFRAGSAGKTEAALDDAFKPVLEIANRYRTETDAMPASIERVIKGSAGVWSDVPMLPHASLDRSDAEKMVRWIYDLKPGKTGQSLVRGLIGRVTAPKEDTVRSGVLEASYTDAGREPAGALTGRTSIRLRNRRIEAEQADALKGVQILDHFLGAAHHGHHARIDALNRDAIVGLQANNVLVSAWRIGENRTGQAKEGQAGPNDISHDISRFSALIAWLTWKPSVPGLATVVKRRR